MVYYAVANSKTIGIFATWPEALAYDFGGKIMMLFCS